MECPCDECINSDWSDFEMCECKELREWEKIKKETENETDLPASDASGERRF